MFLSFSKKFIVCSCKVSVMIMPDPFKARLALIVSCLCLCDTYFTSTALLFRQLLVNWMTSVNKVWLQINVVLLF